MSADQTPAELVEEEQARQVEFDWGALVAWVIHPTKVEIIEALHWIGAALSPYDLGKVFDARHRTSSIAHHMRHLADLDAIEINHPRQAREGRKLPYFLRDHQPVSLHEDDE